MASPVADSYSASSGAAVYGGRFSGGSLLGAALLAGVAVGGGMSAQVSELGGAATLDNLSAEGSMQPDIFSMPGIHDGDSLTAWSYNCDPARWGLPLTRRPPQMIYNYGVPNETITDMLARQSATLAGAAACGAKFVIFRGGTNGVGTGVFATKYAEWVDACISAGLFVFCCQIPPKSSGGSTIAAMNASIESICAARPTTTKYVQDGDAMADGSYNALSGMLSDGIHHAPLGQYTSGAAQAPIFDDYFLTDPRIQAGDVAGQWVTNPLMTGTGGSISGGTGTAPSNWSVSRIGTGSFTASIISADVDDLNTTPWLRVELNALNSGSAIEVRGEMTHPAIDADFTAVRCIDSIAEVRLVGLDASVISFLQFGPDSARTYIQNNGKMNLGFTATLDKTLVMRTSYQRNGPSAYSANSLKVMLTIQAGSTFSTSAGYIDIRNVSATPILF